MSSLGVSDAPTIDEPNCAEVVIVRAWAKGPSSMTTVSRVASTIRALLSVVSDLIDPSNGMSRVIHVEPWSRDTSIMMNFEFDVALGLHCAARTIVEPAAAACDHVDVASIRANWYESESVGVVPSGSIRASDTPVPAKNQRGCDAEAYHHATPAVAVVLDTTGE